MPASNPSEPLTRNQVSQQKFQHQIAKAFRKGKLIEIRYTPLPTSDNLFDGLSPKTRNIIVDPALLLFTADMAAINDNFLGGAMMVSKTLLRDTKERKPDEPISVRYNIRVTPQSAYHAQKVWELCVKASIDNIFKKIEEADPTPNREYVQWVLGLYTRALKDRTPKTDLMLPENNMGGMAYLFFEDLVKLPESLRYFHKVKNSKVLTLEQKDIYGYRSINHFIETVFLSQKDDLTIVTPTDVLNAKELQQLNDKTAAIVHQDQDWIVVHTIKKVANEIFGEQTTWCTAGTRYSSMFDNYNKDGHLFILVRNKTGASSHLKSNPGNRLQFHFESDQFRDVTNHQIDILQFFNDNIGVKNYFRTYILDKLLKKKAKVEEMIKLLSKFGLVRDLIPLLRDAKVTEIDLSGVIGKSSEFDIQNIGEIKTLESLTIRDCGLTKVPETIGELTNLKILRLSGNKITELPKWINKLTSLQSLIMMKNDITQQFDVSGMVNLVDLHLAFNDKLYATPIGMGTLKKLRVADFSFCNLNKIDDDIVGCTSLVQLNLGRNRNLRQVPDGLMEMPNLLALVLDDTGIPLSKQKELMSRRINNQMTVI
jgi:hypothetical protein